MGLYARVARDTLGLSLHYCEELSKVDVAVGNTILITGGAGFIGTHLALVLAEQNNKVFVVDNLSNADLQPLQQVERLTGKKIEFINGNIQDQKLIERVLTGGKFNAVFHLAGLKSASESIADPLSYYDGNINGAVSLLKAMQKAGVYKLVFSSSATVYGRPTYLPLDECHPAGETENPYGRTKWFVENLLQDLVSSDPKWHVAILRYFNPVGAHSSGLIGENPLGTPENLVPTVAKVLQGLQSEVVVHGDDYKTADGTAVRDYIHVMDLIEGHLAAYKFISRSEGINCWNLGTGIGYSVLEVISMFETVTGKSIPRRIGPRRPGDVGECYADPRKAEKQLGWKAQRGLREMISDVWRWHSRSLIC